MNEFAFAANEYVAACGDQNMIYKFVCDALAGTLYYWRKTKRQWVSTGSNFWEGYYETVNTAWTDNDGTVDGKVDSSLWGDASYLGGYHPCKATHEAPKTDEFYDGFVDTNDNDQIDDGEGVIVWLERDSWGGIKDYHATTNLNMNSWTTAKS